MRYKPIENRRLNSVISKTVELSAVNRRFFCHKIFQTKELTAVNSTVFEITELNRRLSIGLYLMGSFFTMIMQNRIGLELPMNFCWKLMSNNIKIHHILQI